MIKRTRETLPSLQEHCRRAPWTFFVNADCQLTCLCSQSRAKWSLWRSSCRNVVRSWSTWNTLLLATRLSISAPPNTNAVAAVNDASAARASQHRRQSIDAIDSLRTVFWIDLQVPFLLTNDQRNSSLYCRHVFALVLGPIVLFVLFFNVDPACRSDRSACRWYTLHHYIGVLMLLQRLGGAKEERFGGVKIISARTLRLGALGV
jgi:hypothetical protein